MTIVFSSFDVIIIVKILSVVDVKSFGENIFSSSFFFEMGSVKEHLATGDEDGEDQTGNKCGEDEEVGHHSGGDAPKRNRFKLSSPPDV